VRCVSLLRNDALAEVQRARRGGVARLFDVFLARIIGAEYWGGGVARLFDVFLGRIIGAE